MKLAGLKIGAAVGHGATAPGTLGAFAADRATGKLGIISNNHVLAATNKGNPGDVIKMSSRGIVTDIGTLVKAVRLEEQCETDAAFARLDYDPEDMSTVTAQIRVSTNTILPKKNMRVWKRGAATGVRTGEVRYAALPEIKLDYGPIVCTFKGLIGVAPTSDVGFSRSGDSGSLVVNEDGDAIGLIIGGSPLEPEFAGLTLVAPIGPVLGLLDIVLVR